jgi:hypothetical protein
MSCEDFNNMMQQLATDLNALNKSVSKGKFNSKDGAKSQVEVDINYLRQSVKKLAKAAMDCQAQGE